MRVFAVHAAERGVLIDLGDEVTKALMHDLGEEAAGVSGGNA